MRVLSMDQLRPEKGIPYSRAHIYRLIKAGEFPTPIKLGVNRVAFIEQEIDAYLQSKIEARDQESSGHAA